MEDWSNWQVADSYSFTSVSCQAGSDIIRRSCPAMPGSGAQRPKSQRDQKGFNLKNSRPVQCQLSLNPPPLTTTPPPPPPSHRAPAAGQGWRGNLIKGSPVTKAPPLLLASCGRLTETKATKWDWLFVLTRAEAWLLLLHKLFGRKTEKGMARCEVNCSINWKDFFPMCDWLTIIDLNGYWGAFYFPKTIMVHQ